LEKPAGTGATHFTRADFVSDHSKPARKSVPVNVNFVVTDYKFFLIIGSLTQHMQPALQISNPPTERIGLRYINRIAIPEREGIAFRITYLPIDLRLFSQGLKRLSIEIHLGERKLDG